MQHMYIPQSIQIIEFPKHIFAMYLVYEYPCDFDESRQTQSMILASFKVFQEAKTAAAPSYPMLLGVRSTEK
jgi:hypothetical protein